MKGWWAVVAAGGAVALGAAVAVSGELPGDGWLLRATGVDRTTVAHDLARAVDAATGTWPVLGLAVVLGLVLRSLQVPLAVALTAVLTAGAKRIVGRDRPSLLSPLEEASPLSFPAGHAAVAAAVVVVLLLVVPRRRRRLVAVIGGGVVLLSAWAQLALARHFPSDLVGGWLVGGAVAAGVVSLWGLAQAAGSAQR